MTCINYWTVPGRIAEAFIGLLLTFSLQAWTLPAGEFKFEAVAEGLDEEREDFQA